MPEGYPQQEPKNKDVSKADRSKMESRITGLYNLILEIRAKIALLPLSGYEQLGYNRELDKIENQDLELALINTDSITDHEVDNIKRDIEIILLKAQSKVSGEGVKVGQNLAEEENRMTKEQLDQYFRTIQKETVENTSKKLSELSDKSELTKEEEAELNRIKKQLEMRKWLENAVIMKNDVETQVETAKNSAGDEVSLNDYDPYTPQSLFLRIKSIERMITEQSTYLTNSDKADLLEQINNCRVNIKNEGEFIDRSKCNEYNNQLVQIEQELTKKILEAVNKNKSVA